MGIRVPTIKDIEDQIRAEQLRSSGPVSIEPVKTDYALLYASLAALVSEARAHLDNHNNDACGTALDMAHDIIKSHRSPMYVAKVPNPGNLGPASAGPEH